MKKTLALLGIAVVASASTGYCKPGGWLLDLAKNSTYQVNIGGPQPVYYQQQAPVYYQTPVYYQQAPVYYRPTPLYYQQPSAVVYYTEPTYREVPPVYYSRPYHRCH